MHRRWRYHRWIFELQNQSWCWWWVYSLNLALRTNYGETHKAVNPVQNRVIWILDYDQSHAWLLVLCFKLKILIVISLGGIETGSCCPYKYHTLVIFLFLYSEHALAWNWLAFRDLRLLKWKVLSFFFFLTNYREKVGPCCQALWATEREKFRVWCCLYREEREQKC